MHLGYDPINNDHLIGKYNMGTTIKKQQDHSSSKSLRPCGYDCPENVTMILHSDTSEEMKAIHSANKISI